MIRRLVLPAALLAACGPAPDLGDRAAAEGARVGDAAGRPPPGFAADPLPDETGWGTHVLAVEVAPDGAVWVGTHGQGIYVSRDGTGRDWERITTGDSTSISWGFVNALAFAPGEVWYGTIGNGWGVSRDGGRTWRNWTFAELGPRWQYVAPDGIRTMGDTVYIATADGLRITADDGATYRDVTEREGLASKYLLALDVRMAEDTGGVRLRVAHLRGVSESADGGRTWRLVRPLGGEETRALLRDAGKPGVCARTALTQRLCAWRDAAGRLADPGLPPLQPSDRSHFWFQRPVGPEDNPHLDQTYTYGSTMGGNFQQHQGVEFNVPEGTPIRAIGAGRVVLAGAAEAGSRTVVILHDRRLDGWFVWSTYYHNSELLVRPGDRVSGGDVIALAGNTGRATNDHLHLEIHVTPGDEPDAVVDPVQRYPPFTRNPQLWIEPLPRTGVIAGRVFSADGQAVPGARVYGVRKPAPAETPFSFAETYEDRAHPDPVFGEHFAIGDVPAGEHVLGVQVEGQQVFRKVRVEPGRVTEVELRP